MTLIMFSTIVKGILSEEYLLWLNKFWAQFISQDDMDFDIHICIGYIGKRNWEFDFKS